MSETDIVSVTCLDEAQAALTEPFAPGSYALVRVEGTEEVEVVRTPDELPLKTGDLVVIDTKYGADLGTVRGPVAQHSCYARREVRQVHRVATEEDLQRAESNRERSAEAFRTFREKVRKHNLDMKLVTAHYLLMESKILFFFTAEDRVDFRELVKDLVAVFRTRVELRQVGVRDESRMLGGDGVCGREFCCAGVSDKLQPVSIKMAKAQNLSLNSMKISGPCGRLLCCLAYEHDFYEKERRRLPKEGARIPYDGSVFRVNEVNVISRQIRLSSNDGRWLDLPASRLSYDESSRHWSIIPLND